MHPDLVATFIDEYQREMQRERQDRLAAHDGTSRQLTRVSTEIRNIVDAIAQVRFHESLTSKLDELEAEKARLEALLNPMPTPAPVALHPALGEIYARKVADLAEALSAPATRSEAADLLRGLIDRIILTPDAAAPNGHSIALYGELGAILSLCDDGLGTNANAHRCGGRSGQETMVAGAGFEPAAFRL